MDYKGYLEEYFVGYDVTEELNYEFDGGDTVFVIKNLGGGQNYLDSVIQPVQILAHTHDVKATLTLLSAFALAKSGTMILQDNEYIRQSYSTPIVISSNQTSGPNHYSQVILMGTLIVSTDLSDITNVEIDGFDYFTTSRKLSYVTIGDTQPTGTARVGATNIKNGILQFQCSMENKNNDLSIKARRLRTSTLEVDNAFIIKLTFSDNDYVEEYTMKLDSFTLDSSNALSPVIVFTFIK